MAGAGPPPCLLSLDCALYTTNGSSGTETVSRDGRVLRICLHASLRISYWSTCSSESRSLMACTQNGRSTRAAITSAGVGCLMISISSAPKRIKPRPANCSNHPIMGHIRHLP